MGRKVRTLRKLGPYESGLPLLDESRKRISVKFFIVAMVFILFDVETALPLAVGHRPRRGRLGRLLADDASSSPSSSSRTPTSGRRERSTGNERRREHTRGRPSPDSPPSASTALSPAGRRSPSRPRPRRRVRQAPDPLPDEAGRPPARPSGSPRRSGAGSRARRSTTSPPASASPPAFVWGVVTFYTMYNRAPVGKHLIQVCTSISCHLNGAEEVFARLPEEARRPEAGRDVARREVHRRRGGVPRPVRQGARRHGERRRLRRGSRSKTSTPSSRAEMSGLPARPLRPPREDELAAPSRPTSPTAATPRGRRSSPASKTGEWTPAKVTDLVKASGLRGRGGAGLPDRDEVDLRPAEGEAGRQARLPPLQRRRVRARHVQGPGPHREGPAPDPRGDDARELRPRREARLHLHPRRDGPRRPRS